MARGGSAAIITTATIAMHTAIVRGGGGNKFDRGYDRRADRRDHRDDRSDRRRNRDW